MTYRILPRTEWCRLAPDFREQGKPLPPDGSRIAVAEDEEGNIRGFLVLQWVPHLEPLSVAERYRGKVYWPHLQHLLEAELQGGQYYVFTVDERTADLASVAGLEALPWTVFCGEVD